MEQGTQITQNALEKKEQMNFTMTNVESDWNLDLLISDIFGRSRNAENMKLQISKALMNTTNHEASLSTRERVTRFIRSTIKSDVISHNQRIKRTLETVAEGDSHSSNAKY